MTKPTNLFSEKDLYIMEHTSKGTSIRTSLIPKQRRRNVIYDNMHLMDGMTFTPVHSFPQMLPYNDNTDFDLVSFSDRKNHTGKNEALCFFLDDYRFRDQLWCNLEYTTYSISHYDYYFTPDFSLWRDLPTEYYNQQNIFRTRFVGLFWQLRGLRQSLLTVLEVSRLFLIVLKDYLAKASLQSVGLAIAKTYRLTMSGAMDLGGWKKRNNQLSYWCMARK